MADVYSIGVEFLRDGGFFIMPISLVFIIGISIALERWLYLRMEKNRNARAFKEFLPLLGEADIDGMRTFTRDKTKGKTPVIRLIGCGLDMMVVSKQRGDIENAMSEGMLETMPRLEQRTNYLSLLANIATLLGLLGTIVGLISAFAAVADADPSEKSKMLSSAISVAMNTTAAGLIAAIPLLVFNSLLQNKTKSIVTSIEMSAVKFLNVMTYHRYIEAGIPQPTQGNSSSMASKIVGSEGIVADLESTGSSVLGEKSASAREDSERSEVSVYFQQAELSCGDSTPTIQAGPNSEGVAIHGASSMESGTSEGHAASQRSGARDETVARLSDSQGANAISNASPSDDFVGPHGESDLQSHVPLKSNDESGIPLSDVSSVKKLNPEPTNNYSSGSADGSAVTS